MPPTGPESPDKLGAINIANWNGGVNWPGSGFDTETGIFYTQAGNSAVTVGHYDQDEFDKVNPETLQDQPRQPRWEAEPELRAAAARPGVRPRRSPGEGRRQARARAWAGCRSSSRLRRDGGHRPQERLAAVPGAARRHAGRGARHPLLKGMNLGKTGQTGSVGVLITKTLVIAGDPQFTSTPGRARGAMLRAYDKQTGEQVGEVLLPAPIVGRPMTYAVNGKQYIIVGVSGGNYRGEYISLALPATGATTTQQPPRWSAAPRSERAPRRVRPVLVRRLRDAQLNGC